MMPDTVEEMGFAVIAASAPGGCSVASLSVELPQAAAIGPGAGISMASLRRFWGGGEVELVAKRTGTVLGSVTPSALTV